jgi:hypothetical protein
MHSRGRQGVRRGREAALKGGSVRSWPTGSHGMLAVVAFPWTEVAAVATAAGAGAAWLAATASRQAVVRANRPFVWPEAHESESNGKRTVRVRLHNDGPGVALDVRWSLVFPAKDRLADRDQFLELVKQLASSTTRGLPPGESEPPSGNLSLPEVQVPDEHLEDPCWVAVRYTDSAGERWQYIEPSDPNALAPPLILLGRGWAPRTRIPRGAWGRWVRRRLPFARVPIEW